MVPAHDFVLWRSRGEREVHIVLWYLAASCVPIGLAAQLLVGRPIFRRHVTCENVQISRPVTKPQPRIERTLGRNGKKVVVHGLEGVPKVCGVGEVGSMLTQDVVLDD